jgi:hypothetical protein
MILKKITYVFFSNLINFNLFFLKKFSNKNYIYSDTISFGETFVFYIHNYHKINNDNNKKVLVFSKFEENIAKLFFTKKKIKRIFFLLPFFIPVYGVSVLMQKKKYFTPSISLLINYKKRKILNQHKIILIKLLKKNINVISPELKKIQNEKFILMFVKHHKNKRKIIDGSYARHTQDFKKIHKLINFFLKKKIKIIIFGNEYDESLSILKDKHGNNKHNVLFFKDISFKQSIYDQLFVHYYSLLSIGSDSGAFIMSQYLKKRILYFDTFEIKNQFYQKYKKTKTLYKKIIYDGKIKNLSLTNLNKIPKMHNKYSITENSFSEIINELRKIKYKF